MKTKCCGTCRHWRYRTTYLSGRTDGTCHYRPRPEPFRWNDDPVTEAEDGWKCKCWERREANES